MGAKKNRAARDKKKTLKNVYDVEKILQKRIEKGQVIRKKAKFIIVATRWPTVNLISFIRANI